MLKEHKMKGGPFTKRWWEMSLTCSYMLETWKAGGGREIRLNIWEMFTDSKDFTLLVSPLQSYWLWERILARHQRACYHEYHGTTSTRIAHPTSRSLWRTTNRRRNREGRRRILARSGRREERVLFSKFGKKEKCVGIKWQARKKSNHPRLCCWQEGTL